MNSFLILFMAKALAKEKARLGTDLDGRAKDARLQVAKAESCICTIVVNIYLTTYTLTLDVTSSYMG